MKNLMLILRREYLLRLRRPSFWVLTLLVPVVLAVLYALPVIAAQKSARQATVLVVDQTGLFEGSLVSTDEVHFHTMPSLDYARQQAGKDDLILFVPMRETTIPRDAFLYYSGSNPSTTLQSTVDGQLQTLLRNAILEDVYQVEPSVYHSVETTNIKLHTQEAGSGKESFVRVKTVVAVVLAVLLTLAIVLFGLQVMRSVQEEKQNRVAEILASTVKPVWLLVGKISGVALTALTQTILWIILTTLCIQGIQSTTPDLFAQAREQQEHRSLATKGVEATAQYDNPVQLVDEAVQGLTAIHLPTVAGMFLLYFLLGYLLYGALLTALASRLDSDSSGGGPADADALQWALLVALPLFVVLVLAPLVLRDPSGSLALWLTVIPFTAPAAVMLRLPFGLPVWQAVLGIVLLLITFAAAALAAARSYRSHLLG